jgi:hypothetical protein
MKINRRPFVVIATLTLFTLIPMPTLAAPLELSKLFATAHGKGTLKVGRELFQVNNVVVKLKEDGTGEITLVTDLQLFVTCTWSAGADLSKGINLTLTGGAISAQGSGQLFLRADGESIDRLSIEGSSSTKRKIQLKFVAD